MHDYILKREAEFDERFPVIATSDVIYGQESSLYKDLKSFHQETVRGVMERVKEVIVDADAPYTTECCRKTANFYKDQMLDKLALHPEEK